MSECQGRTDEELMVSAGTGDLDAFEELVRRYQQMAVGLAGRMLGDAHQAQDVAQEAFLRVWQGAARYRPTAAFRTYFYRVLTRLCIDHWRRPTPATGEGLERAEGPSDPPEEAMLRRERAERVRTALDRLPRRQRTALVLRHYEGLSYEEIASVMDCSGRAVDSMLTRARRRLHGWLSDESEGID